MENEQDLIDYCFLPYSELMNLTEEKADLKEQLTEMENLLKNIEPAKNESGSEIVSSTAAEGEHKPNFQDEEKSKLEQKTESLKELENSKDPVIQTKKPKNINRAILAEQIKSKLKELDVRNLPSNVDDLINGALNNSKKSLENEAEFYEILKANNLQSLITNRGKWDKFIRPSYFKI